LLFIYYIIIIIIIIIIIGLIIIIIIIITIIIRPHRSTTYVDAAYCYRSSSVVCRSVCPCVYHSSEPRKNGCTDRNAVPVVGWDGP